MTKAQKAKEDFLISLRLYLISLTVYLEEVLKIILKLMPLGGKLFLEVFEILLADAKGFYAYDVHDVVVFYCAGLYASVYFFFFTLNPNPPSFSPSP